LTACSRLPSDQPNWATQSQNIGATSDTMVVSTFQIAPTEIPNPTDAALYFSQDQITDGKALLSIQEVQPACHSREDRIQIRFTFKNLTNKTINLVAIPWTGRGRMLNSILTRSDRNIYYCRDCRGGDPDPIVTPVSFDLLPALGVIERVIQYQIDPIVRVEIGKENFTWATPEPGAYFLKFVYMNDNSSLNNVWTGQIASNQIKLCITE